VIIATGAVEEAARRLREEHHLHAAPGCVFPESGLANWVIPVGGCQCIELLYAADPATAAGDPFGSFVISRAAQGDVLLGWAIQPADLDATARRLSLAVTSHSEVWPDGTSVTWRLAGTSEAFGSGFLPFFISWDDPAAISSQLDRVKTHAQDSCDPLDFAWIELGGDNDRLSEWIGPLEIPVRCIDSEPGLRGVGLRSTAGELDLRL